MTQVEKVAKEFVSGQVKSVIMSKLKQAWDNPSQEADRAVQYVTDIIESKYITKNDSLFKQTVYKMLKYVGVRRIAEGVMVVDFVKGCVELVEFLKEADQRHSTDGVIESAVISLIKSGGI